MPGMPKTKAAKTMTTIFTADLHLSANPRDAYRFHFLEHALPKLIHKYKARRVIVGGDVAEVKDGHPAVLVNRVVDGFARLVEEHGVDLIFYTGNHDYVRADVPFWRFLQHVQRVRWITNPTTILMQGLGRCLFLPFTPRPDKDWDSGYFVDDYDWFFCHQTFGGAISESGRKIEGNPPPFTKDAKVVSGDVHVPQKAGPVTYVGAPYTVDFGDAFEPRVLVLDRNKMHSVSVEGPQKRLVGAGVRGKHISFSGAGVVPGDIVKVKVGLNKSIYSRAEIRAAAREWAQESGVTLHAVQIIAARPERTEKTTVRRDRRSDEDLVRAYAKKMRKGKVTLGAGLKITEEVV